MILQARQIHLSFEHRKVLNGVELDIGQGELVALIGPNGAGKTSLLRVLANLQTPDQGSLKINGEYYAAISNKAFARQVGYLEQGAPVYWPLKVRRLVELGRLPHLTPWSTLSADDQAVVTNAMAEAEVAHLADRIVSTLSGGERLRVLIARLFATQPTMILADEPIAALDPYHQIHTMELLKQHCARGGSGVVVMHDLNTAARFCDRLVILNHGELVAKGSPQDVLSAGLLRDVYGIDVELIEDAKGGILVIPSARVATQ